MADKFTIKSRWLRYPYQYIYYYYCWFFRLSGSASIAYTANYGDLTFSDEFLNIITKYAI